MNGRLQQTGAVHVLPDYEFLLVLTVTNLLKTVVVMKAET